MRVRTAIPRRNLKPGQKIVRRGKRLYLLDPKNPRNKTRQG